MSDYLWDKSGSPDPEIEKLEKLLAPIGLQPKPRARLQPKIWIPLAIAACLVLAWFLPRRSRPAWQVRALAGTSAQSSLSKDQLFETDAKSRARLELTDVGQVEIEPNTRLRVVSMKADYQRL
jgi:hypothetical protein